MRDYTKFFTYPETAELMVNLLKWGNDFYDSEGTLKVLEPSAGNGAIVKALRKKFGKLMWIDAVEKDNRWFEELDAMCNRTFIQDFLQYPSPRQYDACVANPPFGNGVDLQAHFDKICECVKEGGQIIMIVPQDFNPPVENRIYRLENWSKNSDGTTTAIKIISFINKVSPAPIICPTTNNPCEQNELLCNTTCYLTQSHSDTVVTTKVICHNCNHAYCYDLNIPDVLWAVIAPKPVEGFKGGGLLCPECIMDNTIKFFTDTISKLDKDRKYTKEEVYTCMHMAYQHGIVGAGIDGATKRKILNQIKDMQL